MLCQRERYTLYDETKHIFKCRTKLFLLPKFPLATLIWKYYSFVKQKDREYFCPQALIRVYQIRKSLIYFN